MKKIINKSKTMFNSALILVLNVNTIMASEISEWKVGKIPAQVPTYNRDIIMYLFKIVDGLFIVVSLLFAVILLKYLFYNIKNDKQNKIHFRKILLRSFILFSIIFIVKIMILVVSQTCCSI